MDSKFFTDRLIEEREKGFRLSVERERTIPSEDSENDEGNGTVFALTGERGCTRVTVFWRDD